MNKKNTETVTTGKLQAGDVIQKYDRNTKSFYYLTVQFVKEFKIGSTKKWRVSLYEWDTIGFVNGATARFNRVTD
jgi:hypothetical protein